MAWSPHTATVFACVNEGAVEVWDLSQNTLDPIIVNAPMMGIKLSCVTFAKNSDVSRMDPLPWHSSLRAGISQ